MESITDFALKLYHNWKVTAYSQSSVLKVCKNKKKRSNHRNKHGAKKRR